MSGSVFGGVHDFFQSSAWQMTRTGLILFGAVLWAATVFWVWKDARRRIASPALVLLSTLVGAIPPFLGPLVYMLFRPPEYLADVRERELEMRAIERRLDERGQQCTVCGCEIGQEFLVCPVCTTKLRQACTGCGRPLEPAWQVCPYCETPVTSDEPVPIRPDVEVPARRPRQPRRTTSSSG